MNDQQIQQELGQYPLEPMLPEDRKLIGAVLLCGLAVLGGLFVLQRYLPLGN